MKYHELALLIAILPAGGMLAPGNSLANVVADDQLHYHHRHHHHHAMDGNGYTRSVASYRIPDVKLIDADGREVSLHDSLEGKNPVMLNFIFTTCSTICPVMSASFSQAQEKFAPERDKVRMVSISIDPEHDTPARLKEYSKKFGAGPQWSMLTGSIENSIAVQRAFNVYRGDKMNHEPVTFMRAGEGQPWVRIDGFISADDLLSEYRKFAPD